MPFAPRILKNRRVLAALAGAALLLAMGMWPRAIESDVARVVRGSIELTVDEEGITRVRQRFIISSPVTGRVLRIGLEPGDPVEKGAVVAAILPGVPTPLDARSRAEAEAAVAAARSFLDQARAEEERARAAANLARAQLSRARDMAATGLVSKEVLDARETEARTGDEALRSAGFAAATASHQLDAARARLLQTMGGDAGRTLEVRSPVTGVIFKRYRESETAVPAGEPLVEVGDPAHLEIVADYLSSDAVRIPAGAGVRIEQWGGKQPLTGRVRRVEPSGFTKVSALGVEEQRVNVIIDFADPAGAWRTLGDGYRVEVRTVIARKENVLEVPVAALFQKDGSWAVFVAGGRRARLRKLETGLRNALQAEVLSGLSEGEEVIIHPSDLIADGTRISRRNAS